MHYGPVTVERAEPHVATTSRRFAITVLVLSLCMPVACARGRGGVKKVQLARLPAQYQTITISDDARSYAYVGVEHEGEGFVVHDGKRDATFPAMVGLTFAPKTGKLFYWAGSDTEGWLVADGTKIGGDLAHEGKLVFSPDGRRWATTCTARPQAGGHGKRAVVFADGKELGRYAGASIPTFSPDGRHLAYVVVDDGGSASVLVDGEPRVKYAPSDDPCAARLEGTPSEPSLWPQFQAAYLADGSLVTMTQDPDGWAIYRDAARLASYGPSVIQKHPEVRESCRGTPAVAAWSLTTAEKAPVAAWWDRLPGSEERWRVVANGKPVDGLLCARPWPRQPPELSPDGDHIADPCIADPDHISVVVDGRRYGPYVDVWAYVWADDAAELVYGAADEPSPRPWRYYVAGQPRTGFFSAVWRPRIEAGSGRFAWEAELERGGRKVLGVDDRQLTSFDDVLWGPGFLRRGWATWVIRRGRRIVRLDVPTG